MGDGRQKGREERKRGGEVGVCRHRTTCPELIVYLIVGKVIYQTALLKATAFKSSKCHPDLALQISLLQEIQVASGTQKSEASRAPAEPRRPDWPAHLPSGGKTSRLTFSLVRLAYCQFQSFSSIIFGGIRLFDRAA